jgi:hypothetical protein
MLREIGPGRVTRYRLLGFQFAIILTGDSADCRTYIKNFWPPDDTMYSELQRT